MAMITLLFQWLGSGFIRRCRAVLSYPLSYRSSRESKNKEPMVGRQPWALDFKSFGRSLSIGHSSYYQRYVSASIFSHALSRLVLIDLASPLACPRWRHTRRQRWHQRIGLGCPVGLWQRRQIVIDVLISRCSVWVSVSRLAGQGSMR